MPGVTDVVQQDVANHAVCLLVPVNAVTVRAPWNVTPHGEMKVHHVEPVIRCHATGKLVSQQHVVTKHLTQQSIAVVKTRIYARYAIVFILFQLYIRYATQWLDGVVASVLDS